VLKVGPVIVVMTAFGMIFPTLLYDCIMHPHEHLQKFHFRQHKFDRLVRVRDEKLRNYYVDQLEW
jgi:hypothetical protein